MNDVSQKNILFISARADFGGGPEHLWQLITHITHKVRPYVACPKDYPYFELFRDYLGNDNIFVIPHRRLSLNKLWQLKKFCEQHAITVLHSHGKGAGLYARLLVLLTRIPCVHTFHGVHMGEYGFIKKQLYKIYEQCMALVTHTAITVSEGERNIILQKKLMPKKKLQLIVNGVSIPDAAIDAPHEIPYKIVSISRFDYQKNSGFVIEVMKHLHRNNQLDTFQFLFIGNGPEKNEIIKHATEHGFSEYLQIVEARKNPHVFFHNSLCYFSSSRWEGMPLAVLEAMAHGLPPVVSDVVGNKDVVRDGKNGLIYPEGNAVRAAEALCFLVNNPDIAQELRIESRNFILHNYDVRDMALKTLQILLDVQ